MKNFVLFMTVLLCCLSSHASDFDYKFSKIRLSDALSHIAEEHPELNLNFIYNELENYTISANIHTDDPEDALRKTIGLNPVSLIRKKDRYYIEALQHGIFAFSGQTIGSDSEPVAGCAIYILSPADSTVITYGVSDADGYFLIPCDHRDIIAKFTSIGYMPTYLKCNNFQLGKVVLQTSPVALNGIKVEAELVKAMPDKTIYLPTDRQKNAANSGVDLLQRMAINQLIINPVTKAVTTNSGQEVKLFINKHLATSEELNSLRMKDVKRVEFLDNPTDVRFKGSVYAINFIVQEYEFGGYTKLSEMNSPVDGMVNRPQLFSKLNFKKMTYDFFVGPDQCIAHNIGRNEYETFHLKNGTVQRDYEFDKGDLKYFEIPVTFRALYSTDKASVDNIFGYTFHDRYQMVNSGSLRMTPSEGTDYDFSRVSPFINRTFNWRGSYFFRLPKSWTLDVTPKFTYGHNSSYSHYTTNATRAADIQNDAKENTYNARLSLGLGKVFGSKHNVTFTLDGGTNYSDITYLGQSFYKSKLNDSFYALQLRYKVNLKKVSINVDGGAASEFISNNVNSFTDPYPFLHLSAGYSPNRKNSLNLWFQFASNTPGIEMYSPNVVQSNEYLYLTGNPHLKTSRHTTLSLSYGFNPTNSFSMVAYANYYKVYKRQMALFDYYDHSDAILRTYINSGDYSTANFGMNATARLLSNSLILQASANLNATRSTGIYDASCTPVFYYLYAQYYVGNFNFTAYYGAPTTNIKENSPERVKTRSFYYLTGGWGNGTWNVSLNLQNFFRTNYNYSKSVVESANYSKTSYAYNGNYRLGLQLSVSYTFDYGKKIKRSDEVGSQGKSSSAILN